MVKQRVSVVPNFRSVVGLPWFSLMSDFVRLDTSIGRFGAECTTSVYVSGVRKTRRFCLGAYADLQGRAKKWEHLGGEETQGNVGRIDTSYRTVVFDRMRIPVVEQPQNKVIKYG